ncbi:MAG: TetR family transcriptional regulator, partial [Bacteroidales bacterium]|nr:TetR family transcriptional regulator [Bacteroidales bacterium]
MDTKHGNATRLKLMETARELFIAKGVDSVGVREIASK